MEKKVRLKGGAKCGVLKYCTHSCGAGELHLTV